ncbi:MAG: hypothetical protein Q8P40_03610 [Nitrospirota bacterium]|nr:hypothetical protein [Nitrospirota bacterium]
MIDRASSLTDSASLSAATAGMRPAKKKSLTTNKRFVAKKTINRVGNRYDFAKNRKIKTIPKMMKNVLPTISKIISGAQR